MTRDIREYRSTAPAAPRGRKALPLASALANRAMALLLFVTVARGLTGDERNLTLVGLALLATAGMLSDTGAASFVLTRRDGEPSLVRPATVVQMAVLAAAASIAVLSACLGHGFAGWSAVAVLVAMAGVQLLESGLKVVRAQALRDGAYRKYVEPEVRFSVVKAGAVLLALVVATPLAFVAMAVVCVAISVRYFAALKDEPRGSALPTLRAVVPFGAAGAASVLYSQVPLLAASALLSPAGAATVAAISRVVQPLEVVPATLTQQATPRIPALLREHRWARGYLALCAIGFLLVGTVVAVHPMIDRVMVIQASTAAWGIAAAAAVLKFGNYWLAATLTALRRPGVRLAINCTVGALAVTAAFVVGHAVLPILGIALGAEALLMVGLLTAARRLGRAQ